MVLFDSHGKLKLTINNKNLLIINECKVKKISEGLKMRQLDIKFIRF